MMIVASFKSNAATGDGIVHPRTTALAGACIEVDVELTDQLPFSVTDIEKFYIRVPELNARGFFCKCNGNAVKTLYQLEHARQDLVFREVLFHFLVGECVAFKA